MTLVQRRADHRPPPSSACPSAPPPLFSSGDKRVASTSYPSTQMSVPAVLVLLLLAMSGAAAQNLAAEKCAFQGYERSTTRPGLPDSCGYDFNNVPCSTPQKPFCSTFTGRGISCEATKPAKPTNASLLKVWRCDRLYDYKVWQAEVALSMQMAASGGRDVAGSAERAAVGLVAPIACTVLAAFA